MFTVCVFLGVFYECMYVCSIFWPRVFVANMCNFLSFALSTTSININTVEVDSHSDLLHISIMKPKNKLRTLKSTKHIVYSF